MKCVNLKDNNKFILLNIIIISIFLSFFLFRGRLGSDDLQAYTFAYNFLINSDQSFFDFLKEENNAWQFGHRKIWIFQNFIIISVLKFFNFFISFNLDALSRYFCGWIISFYTVIAYFVFIKILVKNELKLYFSIFIGSGIFLGSSLISYFTGSYIESLVILLISIRYLVKNHYVKFILDALLVLIKPYYLAAVIALVYTDHKFEKKGIIYFTAVCFVVFIEKIILKNMFTGFLVGLPFNFNIYFILKNIFDTFFSYGFGILFTSFIPFFLILLGSTRDTIIKFLFVFVFIIFISSLTFWHGQGPGGRYAISFLLVFIPEIINASKKIQNLKNYNIIISFIFLIIIFNLPTLEFRNTNIKNYSDKVILTKIVESPLAEDIDAFPTHNINFNNIIFANKIFIDKIFKNEEKVVQINNYSFQIKNVYPMSGAGRIIYILKNNLNFIPEPSLEYLKNKFKYLSFIYFSAIFVFICFLSLIFKKVLKKNEY